MEATARHLSLARYALPLVLNAPSESAPPPVDIEPRRIIPQELAMHLQECEARGEQHLPVPRFDQKGVGYVLDLPLPVPFDMRGYRCRTCSVIRTYSVRVSDVRTAFPGVLVHRPRRTGRVLFMTPRFLVHTVLSFYDSLNARELKRKLVEYYSANALLNASSLAWSVGRP